MLKRSPCHSEGVYMDKLRDRRICLIHREILRFAQNDKPVSFKFFNGPFSLTYLPFGKL